MKIRRFSFWKEKVFVWNSSENFLSPLNVKQHKICAKENWSCFVLCLELEKFISKTIPLFSPLLLWKEFWRVVNSCKFWTKYFHHVRVITFSRGEYEEKKNYQVDIKKSYKTDICTSLFSGLKYVLNNIFILILYLLQNKVHNFIS